MSKGKSDIPALRLENLQEFVTTFKTPPNLLLTSMFGGARNADSDTIKWESQRGSRGMTPFVPPGAPAPVTAGEGIAEHQATAAYWKEKRYFDEEFLNNLRKPGTDASHHRSMEILADNLSSIMNNAKRRKEWMFSKMLFENGFSYQTKGGVMMDLDYGIPADHRPSLTSSYYWDTGGSADILGDIKDGKRKIREAVGNSNVIAMCNSTVLDMIGKNSAIRSLLQTNAFGDGSLMGGPKAVDPLALVNANVIGSLIDIPQFVINDEMYEVKSMLTASVTANVTTWINVVDASDFDDAQTLTIWDKSAATTEHRDIVSVDKFNNKIQIDYPFTASYKAAEDFVTMQRYLLPSDKFVIMAPKVDGKDSVRYMNAPFGLNRHYGMYTDRHFNWDPDGVFIRVQDKGLPVLLHRDSIYVLDVTATTAESATSTTTTTSSSTTTTTTA